MEPVTANLDSLVCTALCLLAHPVAPTTANALLLARVWVVCAMQITRDTIALNWLVLTIVPGMESVSVVFVPAMRAGVATTAIPVVPV